MTVDPSVNSIPFTVQYTSGGSFTAQYLDSLGWVFSDIALQTYFICTGRARKAVFSSACRYHFRDLVPQPPYSLLLGAGSRSLSSIRRLLLDPRQSQPPPPAASGGGVYCWRTRETGMPCSSTRTAAIGLGHPPRPYRLSSCSRRCRRHLQTMRRPWTWTRKRSMLDRMMA